MMKCTLELQESGPLKVPVTDLQSLIGKWHTVFAKKVVLWFGFTESGSGSGSSITSESGSTTL
jgi:hypothetical protein